MAMDELIPTRASLLHRMKDLEDQASWQDFYNVYSRLIVDIALKAGLSRAEAQDVLQETMAAVAKHIPSFRYDPSLGSFKSWLFKMARWRISDQFRKRGRFEIAEEESETGTRILEKIPDPALESLELAWEEEWEKSLLAAALTKVKRQVDPQKYQIFDFYVNKGWAPEKVAVTFNVPINQVYLAKCRITELLREEVARLEKEVT